MQTPDEHVRHLTILADVISAGAIVGAFAKQLPEWAAGAALIWYIVQVWESHTVQKWWRLHRLGRKTAPKRKPRHGLTKKMRALIGAAGGAATDL